MAFIGGVLRIFDEIDFYIFSHSFIERAFFSYMKSAVLSQQCAVTAFGEGFYCRVLQEGQCDDKFDIARNRRKVRKFYFNP